MGLDEELEIVEELGQTEAERIDEETEIQDVEDNVDEIMGEDALETDLEHAYDSFITDNEADYNGYDPYEVIESANDIADSNILHSEGYHVIDAEELKDQYLEDDEGEVIEIEIDEDAIDAYLYDEDDNQIGFVFTDENGKENYCYYIDDDDPNLVYDNGDEDLLSYDKIQNLTDDVNSIYKESVEIISDLKDSFGDITKGLKKK